MHPDMIIGTLGGLFCIWLIWCLKHQLHHALRCIPYAPVTTRPGHFFQFSFFCDQVLCINMYKQHQKWPLGHWWLRCNLLRQKHGHKPVTNKSQTRKKVKTLESIFGVKIPFFFTGLFFLISRQQIEHIYMEFFCVFFNFFFEIGLCWTLQSRGSPRSKRIDWIHSCPICIRYCLFVAISVGQHHFCLSGCILCQVSSKVVQM